MLAGGVVNNTTTGPIVDGDRRMAYTWAFSAGVKREMANNMAVSIDYVGNRGKDNTVSSTSTKGRLIATGRVTRLGVNVVRSDRRARAAAAREHHVRAVQPGTDARAGLGARHQTSTRSRSELEKRMSNHWSGRVSYTYASCYDVA